MAGDRELPVPGVTRPQGALDSVPWVNSIFEQPWWLEAVAPGQWDAVVVREGGDVVARMPYVLSRRYGLRIIGLPPVTQTLGPWLAPISGGPAHRFDTHKRLLGQLIELLPPIDYFNVNTSTALTNWLPFYWAGFQATVRYTYRFDDLTDLDRVAAGFQASVCRGIRKASRVLEVRPDLPLEELIRLDRMTYARQGREPPVGPEIMRRLHAVCMERGAGKVLGAVDAQGRTHAAVFVAWDPETFYTLIGARDPGLQVFGANALLFWEAIRLAAGVSRTFDFEGLMIEPIEHYLRGFGATLTPYFGISRVSRRARAALAAREAFRRLRQIAPRGGQGS